MGLHLSIKKLDINGHHQVAWITTECTQCGKLKEKHLTMNNLLQRMDLPGRRPVHRQPFGPEKQKRQALPADRET